MNTGGLSSCSTSARGQATRARLAIARVSHVLPLMCQVVVDDLACLLGEPEPSFTLGPVLNRSTSFRPMDNHYIGGCTVIPVILDAQCSKITEANARFIKVISLSVEPGIVMISSYSVRHSPEREGPFSRRLGVIFEIQVDVHLGRMIAIYSVLCRSGPFHTAIIVTC